MDGCLTTLWVKRPLSVNQQGQLSLPFLLAGRCASLCLQAARGGCATGGSG